MRAMRKFSEYFIPAVGILAVLYFWVKAGFYIASDKTSIEDIGVSTSRGFYAEPYTSLFVAVLGTVFLGAFALKKLKERKKNDKN